MRAAINILATRLAALPGISHLRARREARQYNRALIALTEPSLRAARIDSMPGIQTILVIRRSINGWINTKLPLDRCLILIAAGIPPHRATDHDVMSLDEETLQTMKALRPALILEPDERFLYDMLTKNIEEFMVNADYLRDPEMLEHLIRNHDAI